VIGLLIAAIFGGRHTSVAAVSVAEMRHATTRHVSPVITRAAVWSLIGMIYAPLYVVLRELLTPSLAGFAGVLAAAAAGGIGAAFYGARHLALIASVIGIACALVLLLTIGHQAAPWLVAGVAIVLSLIAGAAVDFPHRCTAKVGLKFMIGSGMGAFAGALLLGADWLIAVALPTAAAVAFLVSVTGVLYVAGMNLRSVQDRTGRSRFCSLTEGVVIAMIAVVVANSMAAFAGLFADDGPGPLTEVLVATAHNLPLALLGGITAGAITGGLLELFEFEWVDRL
jgi:hypothetical protein